MNAHRCNACLCVWICVSEEPRCPRCGQTESVSIREPVYDIREAVVMFAGEEGAARGNPHS